jgi:sensor histidine kinase YesM
MNPEKQYASRKIALLIIPFLAILSISPVFIALGNDLRLLPLVWVFAMLMMSLIWLSNSWLYEHFATRLSLFYLVSFSASFAFTFLIRASIFFLILPFLLKSLDLHLTKQHIPPYFVAFFVVTVNNSVILIVQSLVRLQERHLKMEREFATLKYQNMDAKYQNLKNQLQPHFLFNALSTLKILMRKSPDDAETYILQLSDLLRASLEVNKKTLNSLEEEMRIATNYLAIQKVRFVNSIFLENQLSEEEMRKTFVPVLTLQTLFENSIKHNIVSKNAPLYLTMKWNEEEQLVVSNNLQSKPLQTERGGTGLSNLNERFLLLGGQALRIQKTATTFSVTLTPLNDADTHY